MTIHPLGPKILLKPAPEKPADSSSLIVIPESSKEKPIERIVVAVGPMAFEKVPEATPSSRQRQPSLPPTRCKVGDTVLVSKFAGVAIKVGEQDYTFVDDTEVLAVVR